MSSRPSATWQFYVGPRGTAVDRSYGSVLDVNGDGRAALLVGAPAALVSGMSTGMAFLYRGTSLGLDAAPFRAFSGSALLERFAASLH